MEGSILLPAQIAPMTFSTSLRSVTPAITFLSASADMGENVMLGGQTLIELHRSLLEIFKEREGWLTKGAGERP